MHVGESMLPAVEAKCQPLMIESELMQERGMQVMHVNGIHH